jgi:hypothetical protein
LVCVEEILFRFNQSMQLSSGEKISSAPPYPTKSPHVSFQDCGTFFHFFRSEKLGILIFSFRRGFFLAQIFM